MSHSVPGSEMSFEDRVTQYKKVFEQLKGNIPRGKVTISEGSVWNRLQEIFPEVKWQCVEGIHNANCKRQPNITLEVGQAPWRRPYFLHKRLQEVMLDEKWEISENLSKRQVVRPTEPASLIIPIFGSRLKDDSS